MLCIQKEEVGVRENYYNNRNVGIMPNDVWCWDGRWVWLDGASYVFMEILIIDVASRKIMRWEVGDSGNEDTVLSWLRKAIGGPDESGGLRPKV